MPPPVRLAAHTVAAYLYTFWVLYLLLAEYKLVARMRLDYLADLQKRPDQFTVRGGGGRG